MSRHLRTRNVDNQRRLRVTIVDAEDVTEPVNDMELARFMEAIHTGGEPQHAAEIPVPDVVIKPAAIIDNPKVSVLFKRPHHYVHYHQHCGSGLYTNTIFYDLRQPDILWANAQSINLDVFESIVTQFEIEAGRLTQEADCSPFFPIGQAVNLVKATACEGLASRIYQYWIERRRQRAKPLIPLFERPPNFDDPSPHVAFRARENLRRMGTRNIRKNDPASFCKVRLLKKDTMHVIHILDQVQKREGLKRNRLLLEAEQFDILLNETDFAKRIRQTEKRTPLQQSVFENLTTSLCKSNYELYVKPRTARAKPHPSIARAPSLRLEPSICETVTTAVPPAARPISMQYYTPAPTHLFNFKFAKIALSSDDEESEPETDTDIAFFNMIERYLQSSDGKPRQKRVKRRGTSDCIGSVQARLQRNGQVWLDPVIFDQVNFDRMGKSSGSRSHHQEMASKCPAPS